MTEGQLEIASAPAKPTRKPRIPRGWSCSPTELAAMTSVLRVLWEARKAAGMPVGAKPRKVTRSACGPHSGCPGLLGRYRELVAEDERDPAALLGAVVRAKLQEQSERTDSPKHVEGRFATGITICREQYWDTNLVAGRALMQRDNKPAKSIDPGPAPRPMPDIKAARAAQREVLKVLKAGQRAALRARR